MIMAKRSKEEREEERKKELLRTLRRGPDLDRFIDDEEEQRRIPAARSYPCTHGI
jgi:hypothetical protein